MSYADWEAVGFELAKVGKAMQWWIGDWVNYGGKRYGETYKAAIDATGMSYGAVKQFASLCNEFEMCRRRHILSFKHHVEVWSLEPDQQDELLDRAEAEGLSCAKLREIVRSMNGGNSKVGETPVAHTAVEQIVDSEEDLPHNQIADNWAANCIKEFGRRENRLAFVRAIIQQLSDAELIVVRDWIEGGSD